MKRTSQILMSFRYIVLVIAGFSLLGCTQSDAPQDVAETRGSAEDCKLSDNDVTQIRAMEAAHVRDVLAGDWDAMIHSYAEDIVVMPPNQPEIRGRAALRSWMEANNPEISAYELSFDEVEGCGDMAYVKGRYRMTFSLEGVSEQMSDSGRFMYILHRTADGSWLVTRDIFSSERPAF